MVTTRWQTREGVDGIDECTVILCRRLVSRRVVPKRLNLNITTIHLTHHYARACRLLHGAFCIVRMHSYSVFVDR